MEVSRVLKVKEVGVYLVDRVALRDLPSHDQRGLLDQKGVGLELGSTLVRLTWDALDASRGR